MAGIEQLEIHSKSYLVRWIPVEASHTISWSLQSHKKSINFGIFKHPGPSSNASTSATSILASANGLGSSANDNGRRSRSGSAAQPAGQSITTGAKSEATSVPEKLESLGMKSVDWVGKCEADLVVTGQYEVGMGEDGMYGMVFDNTHSKQLSKNVTFVVMTFPTSAPPKSAQQSSFRQAMGRDRAGSVGRASPGLMPVNDSSERLAQPASMPELKRNASNFGGREGILSKKRRKRNQGWARRFFSLDFTSSTLSYYKSRNSSALRGAIPLSLAAVGADEKSRNISIDSGAEIWILRAQNQQDFIGWRNALEKASRRPPTPAGAGDTVSDGRPQVCSYADNHDWDKAETLVGKVAGITDSVRRLAKDTDPKYLPGSALHDSPAASPTVSEQERDDYFGDDSLAASAPGRSRIPWRRKSSAQGRSPSGLFRQSNAAQKIASSSLAIPSPNHALSVKKQLSFSNMSSHGTTEDVHDRCMAVLRDLDAVVAQFSSLISESRRRRMPERPPAVGRASIDSTFSQEFFDAEDGLQHSRSQLLRIRTDSETAVPQAETDDGPQAADEGDDSGSESDLDEADDTITNARPSEPSLFPSKPKTLVPLPHPQVPRRSTIPQSVGQPPSLIAFLRKNVGKDLSNIAMPVTANEPLSLLQRQAEAMEYSQLLDSANRAPSETGERLLHIAAFAISSLSTSRAKERAIRKPFNPMLGETFELVREDRGFRYLAEKISHRPVRVACQAEHIDWCFSHAPAPTQKFWGKSAEITTDGKARVRLHGSGDCYSWTPATCFLRNIIAGEKYMEPVSSMTVVEETSGRKAVCTFKAGGMFSGRSEDVSVQVMDAHGQVLPLSMHGKWTTSLMLSSQGQGQSPGTGREIWRVGELVADAPKRYGMTAFAATLNEVTDMEGGGDGKALPPTDSRLRPDQRQYEEGAVDKAETMKAQLEEAQRRRRKEMETKGETWEPRWFKKVGADADEDVWVMKGGNEGADYWSVRQAVRDLKHGQWDGVREVFELQ